MSNIREIYNKMINNEYTFETDEYSNALNELINIYKEKDCFDLLLKMAHSDNFANTFAVSYILENFEKRFLSKNRDKAIQIFKTAINKKYYRANFYLCNSLIELIKNNDDECALYLNMIDATNEIEQNNAIYNLLYVDKSIYTLLNKLSNYDFSIFYSHKINISKAWFDIQIYNTNLTYQKIVLLFIYKNIKDKSFTYNVTDKNNPVIFDFVFFLPDLE
ncbi:hypothetical protein [Wielerella bovis]|uniref:hypothetical protein n=1 Tax=Wielerella bovis TaxID=2917790 RepID=UPI0020189BD6|nr:hypothetical protein [Wielerella bovis]ULJ59718.1 hypothetical protein MIS44_08525 [Wielerella bovis]